jgi:ACS family glucarate transporter-like MFS transporter
MVLLILSLTQGGQIGGALIPIVIGMILDNYNWDAVFLFLAASSIVSF